MARDMFDNSGTVRSRTEKLVSNPSGLHCHLPLKPSIDRPLPEPITAESLRPKLLEVEKQFPLLRPTAIAALELLIDPMVTIEGLSAVIEDDLSLELEIVRVANSPIYGVRSPITVLSQVPARFGLDKCPQLIEIASLSLLIKSIPLSQPWMQQALWFHSFLTACICSELSQLLKLHGNGEEFRCGLIHDLGRLLLGAAAPVHFEAVDSVDFDESLDLRLLERAIMGIDHCDVGAEFAARNGLPEIVANAVRHHHVPFHASQHRVMVALVAMADHMANHLQRHDAAAGYEPDLNPVVDLMFRNDAHRRCLYLTSAIAVMNKSHRSARLVATI